jgi:hypothetical protein
VWREHQGETFIFPQSIRVFPIPSTEYLKYSDFEAENLVRHRKHAKKYMSSYLVTEYLKMSSAVKKRAFPAAVKQEIVQDWKHSTPLVTLLQNTK